MIKYDIKKYEEFFSCICIGKPVYIEKSVTYIPIPELQGFIYPFLDEGLIKIAIATINENKHISPDKFRHMIINCNLSGDTMVKIFGLTDLISIYDKYKSEYNLFVLDDTYDKNIENNN